MFILHELLQLHFGTLFHNNCLCNKTSAQLIECTAAHCTHITDRIEVCIYGGEPTDNEEILQVEIYVLSCIRIMQSNIKL